MPDDPRYVAHARRIEILRRGARGEVRDYYDGYRSGMIRSTRTADPEDQDRARSATAAAALRGEIDTPSRLAYGCGYHDGQHWADERQHRGLIRLAAHRLTGGAVQALARDVLDVDDASLRQMLAGKRPVTPDVAAALRDLALHGE